tara:strand:- start:252 stop:485 length:234 start_codon:yes stop_codon:yes gene_type:complete
MSYSLNNSQATARRVEYLKLSDNDVNDMLLTSEGRRTIGYNYLMSENPSVEIGYDKKGKNYNRSYGPNRAQRRGSAA